MGGHNDTLNGTAQKDLLDKLAKNTQQQLAAKGIHVNDNISLEEGLFLLAAWHYLNTFGYSYSDKPDECHPPHLLDTSQVRPLAKICSIKTNDISAGNIERYIKATIIAQAQVSKGVQDRALQDLTDVAKSLLGQPISSGNEWKKDNYVRTFEPGEEDLNGDQTAVQVDGVLLFCNALIKSGNNNVQLCIIYYMSIYYEVPSEMTKKRSEFRDNAFAGAHPFTPYSIKSEADLKHALETYSSRLFKDHFRYDYEDRPPSLAKAFSPLAVNRRSSLHSSHETRFKQEDWLSSLAKSYLESFNFRDSDMRDTAIKDLRRDLVNFAQKHNTATWSIQYFDRMYHDPSQPRSNASRLSGLVLYFCERGKTSQDYDVSVTFVSILGLFYETMPIQQTVMGDLLSDLCRILPNQDKLGYIFDQYDTRTISGLHALTLECASLAFHKAFRLDWSRINTSVAEPDKVVEAYEVLFDLNTDLSVDAISDEVSRKLFKRDGLIGTTVVPVDIVEDIFEDLVERIGSMADGVTALPEVNQWHMETLKRSFGSEERVITHYAVFLYVFGEQSVESISVRQFLLQYLSVFVEVGKKE